MTNDSGLPREHIVRLGRISTAGERQILWLATPSAEVVHACLASFAVGAGTCAERAAGEASASEAGADNGDEVVPAELAHSDHDFDPFVACPLSLDAIPPDRSWRAPKPGRPYAHAIIPADVFDRVYAVLRSFSLPAALELVERLENRSIPGRSVPSE